MQVHLMELKKIKKQNLKTLLKNIKKYTEGNNFNTKMKIKDSLNKKNNKSITKILVMII